MPTPPASPVASPAAAPVAAPVAVPGGGRRTVVVDDTADVRDLLRLALERRGFEVVGEAENGRVGLEVVERVRPEVVLLDLSMPVMDGLEALPHLRVLVPEATIVVLSAFGATQMAARALAAGADGYAQKGASLTTIVDYVDRLADDPDNVQRALTLPPRPATTPAPPPAVVAPPGAAAGGLPDPAPAAAAGGSAVDLAPFGVVEVALDDLVRVRHANAAARRLLGPAAGPGTALKVVSPALAGLVARHRRVAEAVFTVDLEVGTTARVQLRRTPSSVLIYLDPAADGVASLRRAISATATELRGPVAVLCGIAETIGGAPGEALGEVERARLVDAMVRQARILDAATADLLTASRLQHGTLRVDLAPTDVESVLRSVVAGRPGVEVVTGEPRWVRADRAHLEHLLGNLLDNAAKYGSPPVTVSVRDDADRVCLDVVDRGLGVPEGFETELFTEFARSPGTLAPGAGLGLYVVRMLAEAQGGSVTHRRPPGGGAQFTVRLHAV